MADTIVQIYKRDIQLTHAQILTLRATPIEVIAAPGVDKQIIFNSIFCVIDTRRGAYSNPDGDIAFRWKATTPGASSVSFNEVDKFTAAGLTQFFNMASTEAGSIEQSGNNAAMEILKTGSGEFSAGNVSNSLSIRIYYSIVPYGPFTALTGVQS